MKLSQNQRGVLSSATRDTPYIIVYGSTGSGKSTCGIFASVLWTLRRIRGNVDFAFIAKTQKQVDLVVKTVLIRALRRWDVPFADHGREGIVARYNGAKRFSFYGGNDVRAADRLQGLDLAGAYIDEVVNIPESVVYEINNRLRSVSRPKLYMTLNPDNPLHWFKRRFVDNEAVHKEMYHLTATDNPSRSAAIEDNLSRLSSDSERRRRIDGEWAALYGLVYPSYPRWHGETDGVRYVSVDPAESGVTHALLICDDGTRYIVEDEWRYDGRMLGSQTFGWLAGQIVNWLDGVEVAGVVVDAASPAFITELSRWFPVWKADKPDILTGIEIVKTAFHNQRLVVGNVPELESELAVYAWDETAAMRGEEKPVKALDHGCDALRYFMTTIAAAGEMEIEWTYHT